MTMKRIALGFFSALLLSSAALGAALTPLTGPQDPSQINATFNALIQQANRTIGVVGYPGGLPATTTGTTIQTLGTVTLPPNQLATVGQGSRITCTGSGTATGTNTMTVQVGTATAYAVAGSATTAGVFKATVIVQKTGASTQQIWSEGSFNVTPVLPTIISATQTDTAAIGVTCSGTSTTSANFTLSEMVVENLQ